MVLEWCIWLGGPPGVWLHYRALTDERDASIRVHFSLITGTGVR
jgi:hypothetical protein